jgi:hypothetical protein
VGVGRRLRGFAGGFLLIAVNSLVITMTYGAPYGTRTCVTAVKGGRVKTGTQVRTQTARNALSQDATAHQGRSPQRPEMQTETQWTESSVTTASDFQDRCRKLDGTCFPRNSINNNDPFRLA